MKRGMMGWDARVRQKVGGMGAEEDGGFGREERKTYGK